jgi:NTE family protein
MVFKQKRWLASIAFPALFITITLISGCSSIGKIDNTAVSQLPEGEQRYSIANYARHHPDGDTLFLLAFSGGGTRAAALSYGVLEELRDTTFRNNGQKVRLLDEVDRISSVSGGSFTSAYYGLFGDQIFEDYKDVFLYEDVQGDLSSKLLGLFDSTVRMFSTTSRTEIAINYYDKNIFRGKTFADMQKSGKPLILINATDLNSRSQFIFLQGQFDFLCSDLSRFKVARAVAASSAVPVIFPPILLKRHDDCHYVKPDWLANAEKNAVQDGDRRLKKSVDALKFYLDKNNPPYVTLLDGGITDNLGLRTILKTTNFYGGVKKLRALSYESEEIPERLVVIVVDASTTSPDSDIGKGKVLPSIADTLGAVTDIQLHLYNTETDTLLKNQLIQWAQAASTEEHTIKPFFINLDVTSIENQDDRRFFNGVPTTFALKKQQTDRLIKLARNMLRDNSEYQKLLIDLGAK